MLWGWALDAICEHLEAVSQDEIKRLLINVPPGMMKALDSETPILTTWGWKRHGDLMPGDFVFGPDGWPKRVLACTTEVVEESYKVTFDDGVSIVAGSGHLWEVERDFCDVSTEWRRIRRRVVVTTPDLRVSARTRKGGTGPDRIRVASPIQLPPRRLLIDPYLLGVWLGDGATDTGCFYAAETDYPHFAHLGRLSSTVPAGGSRRQAFHRVIPEGLQTKLRLLQLLGNKHIPPDYMESSVDQRLALLQGIMDTDGSCSRNGLCSFTTVLPGLAAQVAELLCSLGVKAFTKSRYTYLNGKRYGPHYKVGFVPPVGMAVFRLPRKQERAKGSANCRTHCRYVEGVEPVGPRVVKCIQVEGSIYLAGKELVPTHNSLLTAAFWPMWEWGPRGRPDLRFLSFSYADRLSIRDNRRCRMLAENDWYQERWPLRITSDQNQKTLFENEARGWRMASSTGGVGTGARADRLLIDDAHHVSDGESPAKLESTLLWFNEVLPTRLNDPERSAIVVIMQRVHERDIAGEIIARDLGYEKLVLPMEFEPERRCSTSIGFTDPRTQAGELLFPERFPAHVVERDKKAMGSYAWAAQAQQSPAPRGGGMIKVERLGIVRDWPRGGPLVRVWDFAGTGEGGSGDPDYTAGVLMTERDGRAWVIDVQHGRWGPAGVEQIAHQTAMRDGPEVRIVIKQEPGSSGRAIVDHYQRRVLRGFAVYGKPDTGSKVLRAEPFAAAVEAGNVSLVQGPWIEAFLAEARVFPMGAHDDQIDSAATAFSELMQAPQVLVA